VLPNTQMEPTRPTVGVIMNVGARLICNVRPHRDRKWLEIAEALDQPDALRPWATPRRLHQAVAARVMDVRPESRSAAGRTRLLSCASGMAR
jgi:hypothetical protein